MNGSYSKVRNLNDLDLRLKRFLVLKMQLQEYQHVFMSSTIPSEQKWSSDHRMSYSRQQYSLLFLLRIPINAMDMLPVKSVRRLKLLLPRLNW